MQLYNMLAYYSLNITGIRDLFPIQKTRMLLSEKNILQLFFGQSLIHRVKKTKPLIPSLSFHSVSNEAWN